MKIYNKICELLEKPADAERPFLRKISFTGSPFPEINRCLEKFYNMKREFPDFQDVKKLVQNVNKTKSMGWPPIKVHNIAEKTFKEFGEMLKKIRQHDDYEVMVSYLPNRDDPAKQDSELRQKLQNNAVLNKKREQEVIDTFVSKQMEHCPEKADSNQSEDNSENSDQESESENDDDEDDDDVPFVDFKSDEEIVVNDKSSFVNYLGLCEKTSISKNEENDKLIDNHTNKNLEANLKLENIGEYNKIQKENLKMVEFIETEEKNVNKRKLSLLSSSDESSDEFWKISNVKKKKLENNLNEYEINKNIYLPVRLNDSSDESDDSISDKKSLYEEKCTESTTIPSDVNKCTDKNDSNTEMQSLLEAIPDVDIKEHVEREIRNEIPTILKVKECEAAMEFSDNSSVNSMKRKIELLNDEFSDSDDECEPNKRIQLSNENKESSTYKKENELNDEYKLPLSKIISLNESNLKKCCKKKIVNRPMRRRGPIKKTPEVFDDDFYKISEHNKKKIVDRFAYYVNDVSTNPSTSTKHDTKSDSVSTNKKKGKRTLKNKTKVKNTCEHDSNEENRMQEMKENDADVVEIKKDEDLLVDSNYKTKNDLEKYLGNVNECVVESICVESDQSVEEKELINSEGSDSGVDEKENPVKQEMPIIIKRIPKRYKTYHERRRVLDKEVKAKQEISDSSDEDIVVISEDTVHDDESKITNDRVDSSSDSGEEGFFQDINELCEVRISDSETEPLNIDDSSDSADSTKNSTPEEQQREPSPELCILMEKPATSKQTVIVRIPPVVRPAVPVRTFQPVNPMNQNRMRGFSPRATSTPSRQVQVQLPSVPRAPLQRFRNPPSRVIQNRAPPVNQQRVTIPNSSNKIVGNVRPKPLSQQRSRTVTNGVLPTNINRRRLQSNKVPAEEDIIVLD